MFKVSVGQRFLKCGLGFGFSWRSLASNDKKKKEAIKTSKYVYLKTLNDRLAMSVLDTICNSERWGLAKYFYGGRTMKKFEKTLVLVVSGNFSKNHDHNNVGFLKYLAKLCHIVKTQKNN